MDKRPLHKSQRSFKSTEPCTKCGLYTQAECGKMPGMGSDADYDGPLIMFVGEAPGATEDGFNMPFIGKAGQKLRRTLEILDIPDEWCRFTNAVRCRPPKNRNPTKTELKYCKLFLEDEIDHIQPDVLVPLGNVPLSSLLNLKGITKHNGELHFYKDIPVVPAFHPSYILRGVDEDTLDKWLDALDYAADIAENGLNDKTEEWEIILPKTVEEVKDALVKLVRLNHELGRDWITNDVETCNLYHEDPNNTITVISFAVHTTCVSYPLFHKESWWTKDELDDVIDMTEDILLNWKQNGHNNRFDQKMIKAVLDIDYIPWSDTLHVSRLVDAHSKKHGLGYLTSKHLDIKGLKDPIDNYKKKHKIKDYGDIPLKILLPYAGKDTIASDLLHDILYPRMTKEQRALHHQVLQQASGKPLFEMEYEGMLVDTNLAKRMYAIYQNAVRHYEEQILNDEDVLIATDVKKQELDDKYDEERLGIDIEEMKQYLHDRCEAVGNDVYPDEYEMMVEDARETFATKTSRARRPSSIFKFNPNSTQQMAPVLFKLKQLPILGQTDKGNPSTSWDFLKPLTKDDKYEEFHEFLWSYRWYKYYKDTANKYIKPAVEGTWFHSDDTRLRAGYNLNLAKTGRLSSSEPTNMQNWPSPEKEFGSLAWFMPMRNLLKSSPGRKLVVADYSSAELRVMASVANIPGMIKVFNEDRDPHIFVTRMVFVDELPKELIDSDTLEADKEIKKYYSHLRYRAKWTNWTMLFGGDWYTLVKTYGLEKKEAKSIEDRYFAAFPELKQFHIDTENFCLKRGYVQSVLGRRLKLPNLNRKEKKANTGYYRKDRRTALDFPIQGPASDLLLMSMVVIFDILKKRDLSAIFVNTVHDSSALDTPMKEVEEVKDIVLDVMPNLPKYQPEYFPGIDLSWLRVTMKADVDITDYYGKKE